MAAAFSFNCPQCGKTYENVKSKMAGRKVSCTCGKVFRLGPKTEDQIAARAKRKAEKAARTAAASGHPPTLPTVSVPGKTAPKRPTSTPPFEADIPGLEDELDAPEGMRRQPSFRLILMPSKMTRSWTIPSAEITRFRRKTTQRMQVGRCRWAGHSPLQNQPKKVWTRNHRQRRNANAAPSLACWIGLPTCFPGETDEPPPDLSVKLIVLFLTGSGFRCACQFAHSVVQQVCCCLS